MSNKNLSSYTHDLNSRSRWCMVCAKDTLAGYAQTRAIVQTITVVHLPFEQVHPVCVPVCQRCRVLRSCYSGGLLDRSAGFESRRKSIGDT